MPNHQEIRNSIRDIGLGLGFDTETEKQIGPGAKADVIWRLQLPRLGVTNYVFVVETLSRTDIQAFKKDPSVKKIILVSDHKQLELAKKDLCETISYWDVQDVKRTHEHLREALKDIKSLDLPLQDVLVLARFPAHE